jgi:uncharacterized protein YggT (Ycf19 family)
MPVRRHDFRGANPGQPVPGNRPAALRAATGQGSFYNPLCQFAVRATQPLLKPLRRVIPSIAGLDTSSLLLAVIVQALLMAFVLMVTYGTFGDVLHLLMWAIIGITSLFLKIFWVAMIVMVIVSWVAPNSHNPGAELATRSASRCWRRSAAWCRTWAAWTSRRSSPSSPSR